jgi:hypothetical protein
MEPVSRDEIQEKIRELPDEQLAIVNDFLLLREDRAEATSDAIQCMLVSQSVLRREVDNAEEDEAWHYLSEEA